MNYYLTESGGAVAGCLALPEWEEAPKGAIEVTEDQYRAAVAAPYGASWNGTDVVPNAAPVLSLESAKAAQQSLIKAAYNAFVQQPVSFETAGGVTDMFDADAASQNTLMQATQGYGLAGDVPVGFYWLSASNTRVPFTLGDLRGLYQAMLSQGWAAFQKKETLKAQIDDAATVEAVQSVIW